ncbi:imidazole glycerol phosphate synthase subunit HisF [Pseudidiomarina tainanensis]|uniref:Imidazole glycerol phosphate synthase subunit HisF n=1 Tax=Pseudidiomarina tainanensis TaxID=502365 RepID=A0ACD2HIQ7_9GAMM|nr:AglZ/HisF2 family acetamidino modification protein [Pseudidiomarina tainanensis]RZQ56291.1 imidazole glycerol phosphate synthase subunit HisF [Pseudidiomarina tainanensis]
MLRTRVIPCLLLQGEVLVKTKRFKSPRYIGDPINTVRIFNELEVDELCILDIAASRNHKPPNFELLQTITNECFMPLSYGGGINSLSQAEQLFTMGFEKIVLNSSAHANPNLVKQISEKYGSQAVIVSVDVKKDWLKRRFVMTGCGSRKTPRNLVDWLLYMQDLGAGEILLTDIDNEGCWSGFDIDLYRQATDVLSVPVIANGGCDSIDSIAKVVKEGRVSAVGLGNMVVYQAKDMGVLVNFPDKVALGAALK